MKIIVFVTHLYLVISCSASAYEADVSAALQSGKLSFTNKPGLFTAILMEVDKRNITELPWWWINIIGTTLSHPQDTESLGKLIGLFTESTIISLYDTAEVGSVMANIINNVPHMKEVTEINVYTDKLYVDFTVGHERQRHVWMTGYCGSSSLTSTLTQFTERMKYDGEVRKIDLNYITQNEVGKAAVLDILWGKTKAVEVQLWGTHPAVVFSFSLSSGVVITPQPLKKLYLSRTLAKVLTSTDRSTIDRMRMNGVLRDDCEVEGWNSREGEWKIIPWNRSQKTHDWSVLQ